MTHGFPLSPQQQHIWSLLLDGQPMPYRAKCAVLLEGEVNLESLQTAVRSVTQRHEVLRTSFHLLNGVGEPVQVINENCSVSFAEYDLRDEAPVEQERRFAELFDEAGPFDFRNSPPLHVSLITLDACRHVLLLSLPALCSDAAGLKNLVREISSAYANPAAASGCDDALQYVEISQWLNELLTSEETELGREYWWKKFGPSLPSHPSLPFQRRGGQGSVFTPRSVTLKVQPATVEALEQFAGGDLFAFLIACWQSLLWRYSEQSDIVVGAAFDGRPFADLEAAVGPLARHLPIYSTLEASLPLIELFGRVKQGLRETSKWQLSFSWGQFAAPEHRSEARLPFCVEYEDRCGPFSAAGVTFSVSQQRVCGDRFNVKLHCFRYNGTISVEFQYDANLYRESFIEQLGSSLVTLLESAVAQPETPIGELKIISGNELQRILVEWNDTRSEVSGVCVHELFEQQVERTPDAVAVVFADEQVTYAALNERANRLAHNLRERGVGPEVRVGLLLERSVAMVIGVLGVLKAGGVYLPLDPAFPAERLQFMAADAGLKILVTQPSLIELAPSPDASIVLMDTEPYETAAPATYNPQSNVLPENLSYIIYTSGSTGKPKGVCISHGAVVNFLESMQRQPGLTAHDVLLAPTTLSFDISALELLLPLTVGARLIVVSREVACDGQRLEAELRARRATVMQATPATWRLLLEAGWAGEERLKILCGGEALSPELSGKLSACSSSLWNLYGPTETTIWSAAWPIEEGDEVISIGRPIANTSIYLVDARQQPAPVGVTAELFIGGAGVARGYLNRPGLTAERFIPDSFSGKPGARLYRTGDLARYLADGELEFLGRVDAQVKVRGYRIELGEIEAALLRHEEVRECVVTAREDEGGGKRLVAYVVSAREPGVSSTELREHLRRSLPEYMVPVQFVRLERLPLTANGKVDRKALPAPAQTRELGARYQAPRTAVEEMVAGIWCRVLKLDQVGVHDNFFELGGHSLLATQLVSRLRETFEVELPLRALFEQPTVAGLAVQVESRLRADVGLEAPPMVSVPRLAGGLPLSFAQQRLWFIEQLEPGTGAYNLPAAVRLSGALDVVALERSFTELVRRHEALRTRFELVKGAAVQVIDEAASVELRRLDLRGRADVATEARREAEAEGQRPFDLQAGPLLRVLLLQLDEEEHVLVVTMHHIVSDAWSIGIFIRELVSLYGAYRQGQESPLPELPLQYADFAVWQREWLQGPVLDQQLEYWRAQLRGLPVLEMPTDRPRPAQQSYRGSSYSFSLGEELMAGLKQLSETAGVTLFMTLLAGFTSLLSRYTGQEEIVVGTPIANRNRGEVEGLIGLFVNTLVLRTKLAGGESFLQLLGRVREMALEAYTHQDVPFEQLLDELQPERDMRHTPLFQVMFVLQNTPPAKLELSGLSLAEEAMERVTAKFDLTLSMAEEEGRLEASFEYNTDLFEARTIERLAAHFEVLLEGIVAAPEQRLIELAMLTEAERHQLLVEWNDTAVEYAQEQCLHQLFEQQVERRPEAVALVFEAEQVSYRELNERANQLAHYLRQQGVGPEARVGICVERSVEMVVGLLGILKAGGAYVPLDAAYPEERLRFMVADAQVEVLLTQEQFLGRLPEHEARVICLDRDWEEIGQQSRTNAGVVVDVENPAYIIYTSGSTGTPKGVMISHGTVVRLFAATGGYHFDETDVWTMFHSYAFDFSVWELWGALLYGGRLVLIPYWVSRAPDAFYELLKRERVTVLNQTPSAFQQLIRAEESSGTAAGLCLRLVIFGGEALELQSLQPWFRRHGEERPQLVNMYGITETTVHVTYRALRAAEAEVGGGSWIGRPLGDLQAYVLDPWSGLTPVGVPGELHIGGAGLARGYWQRAGLTAERFIPDSFSGEAGARLYRTGDLARYLADGELEFLGRVDAQVKVRGYRIELGEIEAALLRHGEVRECVVTAREGEGGGKRLVAYVVSAREAAVNSTELREHLRRSLPEYMVPAQFVRLERLPLTANGKVDRKALPAPAQTQEMSAGYQAPQTAVEEMLAGIWGELLGVRAVGRNDSFFDLGGDSILSIQLVSRAAEAGLRLTPKLVFRHQTLAALAAAAGAASPALSAQQGEVVGEAPLTPIQRWLFARGLKAPQHYNQAVLLRPRRALQAGLLREALVAVMRHHDGLRLRYWQDEAGSWRQEHVRAAAVAGEELLRVVEVGPDPEGRSVRVAQEAERVQQGFSLSAGLLVRAVLFEGWGNANGNGAVEPWQRLLVVMHHLVTDGVTWRVVIADWQRAYEQLEGGGRVQLPAKTSSYQRWAERLVARAEAVAEQEGAYWAGRARVRAGRLPRELEGGDNVEGSGRHVERVLSAEETTVLLREAPRSVGAGIEEVLVAGVAAAVWSWAGGEAVRVEMEGHGRDGLWGAGRGSDEDGRDEDGEGNEESGVERTAGWFTAAYPLVIEAGPSAGVSAAGAAALEWVQRVREAKAGVPGGGEGYGLVRYVSEGEAARALRAAGAEAEAEVSFNYLGQFDQSFTEAALFEIGPESSGAAQAADEERSHLLQVTALVADKQFRVDWSYSENVHLASTIERLADECMRVLRALIVHSQTDKVDEYNPSDFADFAWGQDDIASIAAVIDNLE